MATKMAPCPKCGKDELLAVYAYECGVKHVECNGCWYLGPGEGSIRQAIKSHNERCAADHLAQHDATNGE